MGLLVRRRRTVLAGVIAVGAHLLVLTALGWRIPKVAPPPPAETLPPLELSLVRIRPEPPAPAAPARRSPKSSKSPAASKSPLAPSSALPASPSASAAADRAASPGAPDCEPEDLPLLTEIERARCRDQIAADRSRRLARGADARNAKVVAEANRAPRLDNIPVEKRAYYDAVAAAYDQQSHGPPMAGRNPGFACASTTRAPAHSLKLGPLPCFITPPQGFLTEESGLKPP
jgi:hypothetical protein